MCKTKSRWIVRLHDKGSGFKGMVDHDSMYPHIIGVGRSLQGAYQDARSKIEMLFDFKASLLPLVMEELSATPEKCEVAVSIRLIKGFTPNRNRCKVVFYKQGDMNNERYTKDTNRKIANDSSRPACGKEGHDKSVSQK